jgi:hypothetical protein
MTDEEYEILQITKSKMDSQLEIGELSAMKEAYEKIFRQEAEKKCRMLLRMGKCEHYSLQKLYNSNKKMKEELQDFYFITINPRPNTDVEEFKSHVLGIWNWCWIQKMYVVLEQRGDTPETRGNGLHAHVLIEKCNNEWGKINTQIRDKFKKFCDSPYENTINVKSKKREWLNDKLDYIKGLKTDHGKPDKVIQDQLWRENLQIKPIYKFEDSTDKKSSNTGGARNNCGVKKGTKRGKYKNKNLNENETNEVKISHKNVKISF